MKVDRNEKICNIRLIKIRDFLRKFYRDEYKSISIHLCDYFNLSNEKGDVLLTELINKGYLEKVEGSKNEYQCSIKGNALSNVRFINRINKQNADKVFAEFMTRVVELNENNDFIYKVKRIVLFGSYLNSETDDFGDIDLGIELERRIEGEKAFNEAKHNIINKAKEAGKIFSNIVEELFYPQYLVFKFLKNRSRYISLHWMDQVLNLNVIYKQVYPSAD